VAELRRDPVSGNWVVVGYSIAKSSAVGECPFCPGNEHLTPPSIREIKDQDGSWLARCFAASNPIFLIEVDAQKRAEGLYDKMSNVGAHEIIVENRSHVKTLSAFDEGEISLVLDLYMDRIRDLKQDKRFKYIQVFKNHGELAGSYLFHPHSHILATPIVPRGIDMELSNAKTHYLRKERCLFCDILSQEIRQNKRVVNSNAHFTAFCPFASRFPYEVWIVPRFHDEAFENLRGGTVKEELVTMLLDIVRRIEKLAAGYTIIIHTSTNEAKAGLQAGTVTEKDYFHWHIEILPRDFRSSKYRREDQFYVIPNTPEEAANSLRLQQF
jgi:UDPglucose--hexose-1-phosphate uridylyltransferase